MQQINLFDTLDKICYRDVLAIKSEFKEYGIDELYKRKFDNNNTYTFHEISEILTKQKTYKEYIDKLFNRLSDFYKVSEDIYYKDLSDIKSSDEILILKEEDCIRLATYRICGPIYTIKMLEEQLQSSKNMMQRDNKRKK